MPCRSDYMEPNKKEMELQLTAQLYAFALYSTNSGFRVDERLKAAGRDEYCKHDYVPQLCALIRSFDEETMDRVVYNAREPKSRKLADWWEKHDAADRQRAAVELEDMRLNGVALGVLNRLSIDEQHALMHFWKVNK